MEDSTGKPNMTPFRPPEHTSLVWLRIKLQNCFAGSIARASIEVGTEIVRTCFNYQSSYLIFMLMTHRRVEVEWEC